VFYQKYQELSECLRRREFFQNQMLKLYMSLSARRRLLPKMRKRFVTCSKTRTGRFDEHIQKGGIKVLRRYLCFHPSTRTSWMFLPKCPYPKTMSAPARRFPKKHNRYHMSLLERRRLLPKNTRRLAMFIKPPIIHHMSTLEEAGIKILPRCLCFSPSIHILPGVLPKP